jgi:hypothetical protein
MNRCVHARPDANTIERLFYLSMQTLLVSGSGRILFTTTLDSSNARHSHNKLGIGIKKQPNAGFLVVAGQHGAFGHSLDLKFGMHFLKFGLNLFVGLAHEFGVWRFSSFVGRHRPAWFVCQRLGAR